MLDEITTQSGWFSAPGPINLRHNDRHHIADTHAAEGIIVSVLIGVIVLEILYLTWRLW